MDRRKFLVALSAIPAVVAVASKLPSGKPNVAPVITHKNPWGDSGIRILPDGRTDHATDAYSYIDPIRKQYQEAMTREMRDRVDNLVFRSIS